MNISHAQNNEHTTQIDKVIPLSINRRIGDLQKLRSQTGVFLDRHREFFKGSLSVIAKVYQFNQKAYLGRESLHVEASIFIVNSLHIYQAPFPEGYNGRQIIPVKQE